MLELFVVVLVELLEAVFETTVKELKVGLAKDAWGFVEGNNKEEVNNEDKAVVEEGPPRQVEFAHVDFPALEHALPQFPQFSRSVAILAQ